MRIGKKSFFTLLELLIVLLILSLGVVLTGVKLKEAYEEQRFVSEVQQVLDYLRMAQDLMLIMDADVQVKLSHSTKAEQIECSMEVEKPLKDSWAHLIERRLFLSAIRSYQFNDSQEDPLLLRFALGKMSQGRLTFSAAAAGERGKGNLDSRTDYIDLPGYPSPFVRSAKSIKEKDKVEESALLYPAEVYEELYLKQD